MVEWILGRKLNKIGQRSNPDRKFVHALEKKILGRMATPSRMARLLRVATGSIASTIMLCAGTGAYAYTSDVVLPTHPLYSVRQAIEKTEDVLAFTPEKKADVRLRHARRRLHERFLLEIHERPVTVEQVDQFVKTMDGVMEANGKLNEEQRKKYDDLAEKLESTYVSSFANERDTAKSPQEQKKSDSLMESQEAAFQQHVDRLEGERKEKYQGVLRRLEQRRALREGRSAVEENSHTEKE